MAAPENIKAGFLKERDVFAEQGIRYVAPFVSLDEPQARAQAALRGAAGRLARAHRRGDGAGGGRRLPRRCATFSDAAAPEVARGARVVRAREPAVPAGAGAAVPHGSRHRPRDRGRPAGLRLPDPLGAVLPDRRRPDASGRSAPTSRPATSSRRSTSGTCGRRPTARTPTRSCGAPRSAARMPVDRLRGPAVASYECGMDQPTYTPVQQIVERSGTLFFSFQDLDSTKPAGSVKIRVETITHYLAATRRRSSRRRRRPCRRAARSSPR